MDREPFLAGLSSITFEEKQKDIFARLRQGTGQWMLLSDEFQQWFKGLNGSTLWCYGMPGGGKTVLMQAYFRTPFSKFTDQPQSLSTTLMKLQREGMPLSYIYFATIKIEERTQSLCFFQALLDSYAITTARYQQLRESFRIRMPIRKETPMRTNGSH